MPERTLDQVIAHYQGAGQQVAMPTPVPPPMVTPRMAQRPPYIVPNAFQSTQAPGMSRTIEHFMGAGTTMGMGPQMAPPVTPQPVMAAPIPMAGMTPNPIFHDPFQAMQQRNVMGLATTAGGINRQWVQQAGERWGGRIGAGVGAIGGAWAGGPWGALQGASLGEMFGGWAGGVMNDIPLVGWGMRTYNKLRWGGAMEQMAGANRLRQGMFGANMQLTGAGANPLTGGLGATGALQMSQAFGRANIPGMNRNDLINLAGAAGETGFLSDATSVEQITKTVKGLAKLMGEMAQLTGDPDFRNNLRQLANLRNAGMDTQQAMEFMRAAPMFGRMAGGAAQAQQGAQMGAAMFQAAGLTPALGMQMGMGTAGMVNRGMGGITATQRGLWGGQEGITQALTGMQAQFMGRTAEMLLPYLVEQGEGGQLQINQQRMRALRGGRIGFQQMMQQGAANIGQLGFGNVQELLMQAPELQAQLGQQLGPMGGMVTMANMARRLQQEMPGLTFGGAATTIAGGGREGMRMGRMLQQFAQNPEMARRLVEDINIQQRQIRARGRQTALAGQEEELGWFGRWREGNREEMRRAAARDPEMRRMMQRWGMIEGGTAEQEMEAFERTQEQAAEEAERTGLRRLVHRPGARVSRREEELARGRMGMAREIQMAGGAQEAATGVAPGELTEAQEQAVARWRGGELFWGTRLLQPGDVQRYRQRALGHIRQVGTRIREVRKGTEEQFGIAERGMRKSMEKQFGDKYHEILATIKTDVTAYARRVGSQEGIGLRMSVIRGIIRKAVINVGRFSKRDADRWMAKNGAAMERWAVRWIDQSGDKNAMRALQRTEGAMGLAENAFSAEAVEENEEELTKSLNETYYNMGLAAEEEAPSGEEEKGISALFEEEDPNVRAAATLIGQMGMGTDEEERALTTKLSRLRDSMGEARWARAQKIAKKLVPRQRERLRAQWGGKIARGEVSMEEYAQMWERGIRGEGKAAGLGRRTILARRTAARREAGKEEEPTEVGEGAGLRTRETEKQVAVLEEQKQMLQDMARNMNRAANALQKTSDNFAEAVLRGGVPSHGD